MIFWLEATMAIDTVTISNVEMNTYGRQAERHMRRYLPARFATIPDPQSYFRHLGEEIAAQILLLEHSLTPAAEPGQAWIDTLGKAKMARMMAEAHVMAELVWLTPEEDPDDPVMGTNGGWIGSDPGLPDLIPAGMGQADLDEMDALA